MNQISHVEVGDMPESKFLRPKRISYFQRGKKKNYDCIEEHDDVVILIYNLTRDRLIFVKQFRPAVYLHLSKTIQSDATEVIDSDKYHGDIGMTLELCSGIVDSNLSLEQIAQAETLEECGYFAPVETFTRITSYRCGGVLSGPKSTLFFVQVTDSMHVSTGGGLWEEGELIEVVEMTLEESKTLLMDESANRDLPLLFALQWFFYQHKYAPVP